MQFWSATSIQKNHDLYFLRHLFTDWVVGGYTTPDYSTVPNLSDSSRSKFFYGIKKSIRELNDNYY